VLEQGTFRESLHAAKQRCLRNISQDDYLHGLERDWILRGQPEYDEDRNNWKYAIQTTDVEGARLDIILAVSLRNRSLTVITVW
jgi:hypothetical protein